VTFTLVVGAAPVEGAEAFYRVLLGEADHVVAADAAAEWCVALGRIPDVAVGDFDSSAPGAPQRLRALGCEVVEHSEAKDATDLDLAVEEALRRYDAPVRLTAAFSLRLDHTLAALGSLVRAGECARVVEPGWWAAAVTPETPGRFDLVSQTTFSVMAVGIAAGVGIQGARWPLSEAVLDLFSGRGVSNVATGGPVTVICSAGTLLVIVEGVGR
jgi:thiamine pyrophosphokinase